MGDAPTDAELEALGLYDPAAPHASAQLELLHYLIEVGATTDDLIEYRDELPALGTVVMARPGVPRYTTPEVAERIGISQEFLERLDRAAGFADPPADVPTFSDADVEVVQLIAAARELFGEESVLQLSRVIGSSLARIADAAVSAFLVNVEVDTAEADPAGLAVARANVAAGSLLPGLSRAMDVILRRHILAARRSLRASQQTRLSGFEVQHLAVGFVDLVGSTVLAQQLSVGEFGRALSEFEGAAGDLVTMHGGRLVKLIGDEVMYVSSDVAAACVIALDLADAFADHSVLPPVRGGVAVGDVLTREGDYFGPIVNVAARLVKEAASGAVAVTDEVRRALPTDLIVEPMGRRELRGLDEERELFAVKRLSRS